VTPIVATATTLASAVIALVGAAVGGVIGIVGILLKGRQDQALADHQRARTGSSPH
jgi:hypothetical protein